MEEAEEEEEEEEEDEEGNYKILFRQNYYLFIKYLKII